MDKIKIVDNISRVDINKVKPNKWNPNKQSDFIYEKEKKSIIKHGFVIAVNVREVDDYYEIIDGEHRWKAAKDLGMKIIPINNHGKISIADAKRLTIILNETKGQSQKDLMGSLLKDLSIDIPIEELKEELPFDESEIDFLIQQSQIDWDKLGDENESNKNRGDEDWTTITLRLPESVAEALTIQINRFKKNLHPEEKNLDKVSPVQSIEFMTQTLAQTPDEHIFT